MLTGWVNIILFIVLMLFYGLFATYFTCGVKTGHLSLSQMDRSDELGSFLIVIVILLCNGIIVFKIINHNFKKYQMQIIYEQSSKHSKNNKDLQMQPILLNKTTKKIPQKIQTEIRDSTDQLPVITNDSLKKNKFNCFFFRCVFVF